MHIAQQEAKLEWFAVSATVFKTLTGLAVDRYKGLNDKPSNSEVLIFKYTSQKFPSQI